MKAKRTKCFQNQYLHVLFSNFKNVTRYVFSGFFSKTANAITVSLQVPRCSSCGRGPSSPAATSANPECIRALRSTHDVPAASRRWSGSAGRASSAWIQSPGLSRSRTTVPPPRRNRGPCWRSICRLSEKRPGNTIAQSIDNFFTAGQLIKTTVRSTKRLKAEGSLEPKKVFGTNQSITILLCGQKLTRELASPKYLFHSQTGRQDIPFVLLLVINLMFLRANCPI